MKIYTTTGDEGMTSLVGGTRVSKFDTRVEAYGTIDELNSYIGLIRSQNIDAHIIDILHQIQGKLMDISAIVASDGSVKNLPKIDSEDVRILENEIDKITAQVEPLRNFILPGGHTIPAFCHIARTVCRRAERVVLKLNNEEPLPQILLIYINRLSDYLFMLARKLHKDLDIQEILWFPEK